MTTNNAVNTGLSGTTGSGNFVGANTPTLITPNIGAATATSVVFSPTTSGIIGTTTNDDAAAGKVGEAIQSQVTFGSPVTVTASGQLQNLTSIALTAGDWDVYGGCGVTATTVSVHSAGISTTSATLPDNSLIGFNEGLATSTAQILTVPSQRLSLSGNTTVYMVFQTTITGTGHAYGILRARRVR